MKMGKIESWERVNEGLKKSSSRARELGKSQANIKWFEIANSLDEMLNNANLLYSGGQISKLSSGIIMDQIINRLKN